MAFWSSERIRRRAVAETLIQPFDETCIKHGSYELALGPEAFITSNGEERKQTLADGEQLVIPPGQFGLLITEEQVSVPRNALGFISIKAGIKFRGLVNVSGFHVDSGFQGRLKFSVYNAGSHNIILARHQKVFLIWFSDLDQETSDYYRGSHFKQHDISSEDVMLIQGKVHSPAVLDKRLTELEHSVAWIKGFAISLLAGILLLGIKFIFDLPPQVPVGNAHTKRYSEAENKSHGENENLEDKSNEKQGKGQTLNSGEDSLGQK